MENDLLIEELIGQFISDSIEMLDEFESKLSDLKNNSSNEESLRELFRITHTLKGNAAYLNVESVKLYAHEFEYCLDKKTKQQQFSLDQEQLNLAYDFADMIRKLIHKKDFQSDQGLEEFKQNISHVFADDKNQLYNNRENDIAQSGNEPQVQILNLDTNQAQIKISQETLEKLMNLSAELVITKNSIGHSIFGAEQKNKVNTQNIHRLSQISQEFQEIIKHMRLVPLDSIFSKLPRMVRELSRQTQKDVDLLIEGGQTLIDKNILNAIFDPLVHLIRNSIDHGIENESIRTSLGKPTKAIIKIQAFKQNMSVFVKIKDDGSGVNVEKIFQKALSLNLVESIPSANEIENMSGHEILKLICLPGFSTADRVSEISGRGVGMDVVKSSIEKFGGQLDLYTKKHIGSEFTIELPLKGSILNCLLYRLNQQIFAIDLNQVYEVGKIKEQQIFNKHGQAIVNFKNTLFTCLKSKNLEGEFPVIFLKSIHGNFVLPVDKVIKNEEIVLKDLPAQYESSDGIIATSILGDGTPLFVCDSNELVKEFNKKI